MSFPIALVKALAKANRIHVSAHAFDRMGERMIPLDEVMRAIEYGEVIEIQGGPWHFDVKVLFQKATPDKPQFYVVVAASYPEAEIVTVILPDDDEWELCGTMLRRKNQ